MFGQCSKGMIGGKPILVGISLAAATGASAWAAGATCQPFQSLAIARLPQKLDPFHSQSAADEWRAWAALEAKSIASGERERFLIQRTTRAVGLPSYQVRGQREAQGWRLDSRVDHGGRRLRHRWSRWRRVHFPSRLQAELDQVWTDNCLWTAPRFLAATLPLASGEWVPSFDGPVTYFDLWGNGRDWNGAQMSWRLGKPAELASIALRAAFGSSGPDYPLDTSVTGGIVWADELGEHQLTPPTR
jgi:hypothetical protein